MGPKNTEADPGISSDIANFLCDDFTDNNPSANVDLSSMHSEDLDILSPSMWIDEDGPPSIGSGGSDSGENREVSGITSNWISSGGQYAYSNLENQFKSPSDANKDAGQTNMLAIVGTNNFGGVPDSSEQQMRKGLHGEPARSDHEMFMNALPSDVLDEHANSGVCGLTNIGNTCFMAAGVQCLVNTPPIAQYFFSHNQDQDGQRSTLAGTLSQLVHKIWSGKYTSIQPTTFKEYFGNNFTDFKDFRQHDCQEFLLLLFDVLRKQMPISKLEAIDSFYFGESAISVSSIGSSEAGGPSGSRTSTSPTPPQSPVSASSFKQYSRSDTQDDIIGIDSGPVSPKSSVSSSSTDPHLVNLRMRPIPEEVRQFFCINKMDTDDVSVTGTLSAQDLESVNSDMSEDCPEHAEAPNAVSRQYNRLSTSDPICDTFDCDKVSQGKVAGCDSQQIEKNHKAHLEQAKFVNLQDIMKESRTSNVNVQIKDAPPNNKLFFDSDKYGKSDCKKLKSVDNLNRGGGATLKRVKEVNLLAEKMDSSNIDTLTFNKQNNDGTPSKKIKLDDSCRLANKNSLPADDVMDSENRVQQKIRHNEQHLADDNWKKFCTEGDNAIVNTFYGQYKSSIVCCVCSHTSDKFEPFGTLTLPLPNASIIQIVVVFVAVENCVPRKYLLSISKLSNVEDIINKICEETNAKSSSICIAEVFDNHISRILDGSTLTKLLNHSNRSIYAFELPTLPPSADQDKKPREEGEFDNDSMIGEQDTVMSVPAKELERQCRICLEEKLLPELSTHANCTDCWLCDQCIKMSVDHHGVQGDPRFPCPVCQEKLTPDLDLVRVAENSTHLTMSRTMKIPIVFRRDTESQDNNKRDMELVGHPCLVLMPNKVRVERLLQIVRKRILVEEKFQLLLVDGKGLHCSRCLYNSHCHGCEAVNDGEVTFKSGDTLCVRFTHLSDVQRTVLEQTSQDPSLASAKLNVNLTLRDCLKAYTRKELMEGCEAWYCPKCQQKQKATKTISIWRNPPFLIVHLERFHFQGNVCNKLDDRISFPVDGFDMTEFTSRDSGPSVLYNLYGCVCHCGSSAECGHYTSLARSPLTGEWHSFNDSTVTSRKPSEDEFSLAYILFFYREGVKFDLTLPVTFPAMQSPAKLEDDDIDNALPRMWNDTDYDQPVAGCSPRPLETCPSRPPTSPDMPHDHRPMASPVDFLNMFTPPASSEDAADVDQIITEVKELHQDQDG